MNTPQIDSLESRKGIKSVIPLRLMITMREEKVISIGLVSRRTAKAWDQHALVYSCIVIVRNWSSSSSFVPFLASIQLPTFDRRFRSSDVQARLRPASSSLVVLRNAIDWVDMGTGEVGRGSMKCCMGIIGVLFGVCVDSVSLMHCLPEGSKCSNERGST